MSRKGTKRDMRVELVELGGVRNLRVLGEAFAAQIRAGEARRRG